MVQQGGSVQLEQSNMRLGLNMAEVAKRWFSRAAIEEVPYLIKKPEAKVRDEKICGIEFPWNNEVKYVIERHPAMFRQNHTAGCLSCQNGSAEKLQTHWRYKETGAAPPYQCRQPTPQSMLYLPRTPPTPTSNIPELSIPKSSVCHPDMCIHIHLFAVLNVLLLMQIPRMASTI